jgi:hypothetical protein
MPISLGENFFSLRIFMEAVLDWALDEHFEVFLAKSDKKKVIYTCRFTPGCPWKIRATYNSERGEATCTVLNPEHNCAGHSDVKRSLASRVFWLLEIVPKLLAVTATSPEDIQESLRLHREVEVLIIQCRRVKAALLQISSDQSKEDYSKLPAYLERLKEANKSEDDPEGPITDLIIEDGIFKRIFIGPHTSEQAFAMSVPFIALDGTFLVNCFKKTLLTATGRTANGKIILLAWAIVESENTSSWEWFLSHLLQTLPTLGKEPELPSYKVCVAEDRDKGLKAAEACLKYVTIINCCWHLMNNVTKASRAANKEPVKEAWWRFPYVRNQFEWDKAIEKLQEVGGQVNINFYNVFLLYNII